MAVEMLPEFGVNTSSIRSVSMDCVRCELDPMDMIMSSLKFITGMYKYVVMIYFSVSTISICNPSSS